MGGLSEAYLIIWPPYLNIREKEEKLRNLIIYY